MSDLRDTKVSSQNVPNQGVSEAVNATAQRKPIIQLEKEKLEKGQLYFFTGVCSKTTKTCETTGPGSSICGSDVESTPFIFPVTGDGKNHTYKKRFTFSNREGETGECVADFTKGYSVAELKNSDRPRMSHGKDKSAGAAYIMLHEEVMY